VQALRDRNFRLLFAGRAISYIGTYLAPIAVAFAILDRGGGATAVGLSFAAWTLAQVAMLGFGGVVGDRLPRRAVMISSDVASTCVRTAMGVLLVTGHGQVWELIVLQAFGGASVAFYNPAFYGLVREIVRPELMQEANSYLAIARFAAFPLGAASAPVRLSSSTVRPTPRARYSSRRCTSFRSRPQPEPGSCGSSATAGARSSSTSGSGC
jgi:MFS family permease